MNLEQHSLKNNKRLSHNRDSNASVDTTTTTATPTTSTSTAVYKLPPVKADRLVKVISQSPSSVILINKDKRKKQTGHLPLGPISLPPVHHAENKENVDVARLT